MSEQRRTHGRVGTYVAGCRCTDCRAANSNYRRKPPSRPPAGRLPEFEPTPWADQAACVGQPTAVFFPRDTGPQAYDQALAVCARCPVRAECLDYALRTRQVDGMWGGVLPGERYRRSA